MFSIILPLAHMTVNFLDCPEHWDNKTSNCYSVDGSCGDTAGSYAGNSNIESGIIIGVRVQVSRMTNEAAHETDSSETKELPLL